MTNIGRIAKGLEVSIEDLDAMLRASVSRKDRERMFEEMGLSDEEKGFLHYYAVEAKLAKPSLWERAKRAAKAVGRFFSRNKGKLIVGAIVGTLLYAAPTVVIVASLALALLMGVAVTLVVLAFAEQQSKNATITN